MSDMLTRKGALHVWNALESTFDAPMMLSICNSKGVGHQTYRNPLSCGIDSHAYMWRRQTQAKGGWGSGASSRLLLSISTSSCAGSGQPLRTRIWAWHGATIRCKACGLLCADAARVGTVLDAPTAWHGLPCRLRVRSLVLRFIRMLSVACAFLLGITTKRLLAIALRLCLTGP